jgi:hypothetical protein
MDNISAGSGQYPLLYPEIPAQIQKNQMVDSTALHTINVFTSTRWFGAQISTG